MQNNARAKVDDNDTEGTLNKEAKEDDQKPLLLSLPFKGDVPNSIVRSKLGKITQDTFNGKQLKAANKTTRLLHDRNKDPVNWLDRKGVVYEPTCSRGEKYIGMTTRPLAVRLKEHLAGSPSSSTVILDHLRSTNHDTGPDNFRIRTRA